MILRVRANESEQVSNKNSKNLSHSFFLSLFLVLDEERDDVYTE